MKNMVEDRFDDISVAITNNRREIELDLIRGQKLAMLNKARSAQTPLLLSDTGLGSNLDRNSLRWPTNNQEEGISDVEDLRS